MTDDLSGLEGWVETVYDALGPYSASVKETAERIVLALAEPLRRAERVEQLTNRLRIERAGWVKQVDEQNELIEELEAVLTRDGFLALVDKLEAAEKRIEDLEAALAFYAQRIDSSKTSSAVFRDNGRRARQALNTEAKP